MHGTTNLWLFYLAPCDALRPDDDYLFHRLIYLPRKKANANKTQLLHLPRARIELSPPKGQLQFVHVKFDRLSTAGQSHPSCTVLSSSHEAQLSWLNKGETIARGPGRLDIYCRSEQSIL